MTNEVIFVILALSNPRVATMPTGIGYGSGQLSFNKEIIRIQSYVRNALSGYRLVPYSDGWN